MQLLSRLLTYGGLLAVAAGLLLVFAQGADALAYKIVYSAGAVATLAGRALEKCPYGNEVRVRRLYKLQVWSAVFFVVAAFFLWYDVTFGHTQTRDWLAFTLAGAVVQAYVSIALSLYISKHRK